MGVTACAHPRAGRRTFCPDCNKVVDPDVLRSIDLKGFTGGASLNPRVETFYETGDPAVLKRR